MCLVMYHTAREFFDKIAICQNSCQVHMTILIKWALEPVMENLSIFSLSVFQREEFHQNFLCQNFMLYGSWLLKCKYTR